jgi:hypothetical protein
MISDFCCLFFIPSLFSTMTYIAFQIRKKYFLLKIIKQLGLGNALIVYDKFYFQSKKHLRSNFKREL